DRRLVELAPQARGLEDVRHPLPLAHPEQGGVHQRGDVPADDADATEQVLGAGHTHQGEEHAGRVDPAAPHDVESPARIEQLLAPGTDDVAEPGLEAGGVGEPVHTCYLEVVRDGARAIIRHVGRLSLIVGVTPVSDHAVEAAGLRELVNFGVPVDEARVVLEEGDQHGRLQRNPPSTCLMTGVPSRMYRGILARARRCTTGSSRPEMRASGRTTSPSGTSTLSLLESMSYTFTTE